jgi:hypothetical protein
MDLRKMYDNKIKEAESLSEKGEYEKAISIYKKLMKGKDKNRIRFALGVCYSKLKNYAEAQKEWLKALEEEPNNEAVLYNLAIIHYRSEQDEAALHYLNKILKINPNDTDAKSLKAKIQTLHRNIMDNKKKLGTNFFLVLLSIFVILSLLPFIGIGKPCLNENFFSRPFCVIMGVYHAGENITSENPSNNKIQPYCGDGQCGSGETCSNCPSDCGQCIQPTNPTTNNIPLSYSEELCSKIEDHNTLVRDTAVIIARNSEGDWNVGQLIDLFNWMKTNIKYVNDPRSSEYWAYASETLTIKAGDCDDQAILIVSLIRSVGGTSKIVVAPGCSHAFAVVFIGNSKQHFDDIRQSISTKYYNEYRINTENAYYYIDKNNGYWLVVDPAGGSYLGDILPDCQKTSFEILDC